MESEQETRVENKLNSRELYFEWRPETDRELMRISYKYRGGQEHQGSRILIVDDEMFNIDALKIVLQFQSKMDLTLVEIDHALSGQQALDMVEQDLFQNGFVSTSYSIIFMDCNMPGMDGYQCTTQIRQMLYAQRARQPLIAAVTGHTEPSYVNRAIASGMNMVASKPVDGNLMKYLLDVAKIKRF